MRREQAALTAALDLLTMPSRVRLVRSSPLPAGVALLLELAARDEAAGRAAVEITERPVQISQEAATFFIEQILLSPEADSYRILGANNLAPAEELRRNMAMLLRWLHPDLVQSGDRSIFARRVTAAWEDLKTPERRLAYDLARQKLIEAKSTSRSRRSGRNPSRSEPDGQRSPLRGGERRPGLWQWVLHRLLHGRPG